MTSANSSNRTNQQITVFFKGYALIKYVVKRYTPISGSANSDEAVLFSTRWMLSLTVFFESQYLDVPEPNIKYPHMISFHLQHQVLNPTILFEYNQVHVRLVPEKPA